MTISDAAWTIRALAKATEHALQNDALAFASAAKRIIFAVSQEIVNVPNGDTTVILRGDDLALARQILLAAARNMSERLWQLTPAEEPHREALGRRLAQDAARLRLQSSEAQTAPEPDLAQYCAVNAGASGDRSQLVTCAR